MPSKDGDIDKKCGLLTKREVGSRSNSLGDSRLKDG
jgi:hypothetical protein